MSDFVEYLDSLSNLGISPSLDSIKCLSAILDEPQANYDSIQVTGTNGKTSVSKFLSAILSNHKKKCGLYLSPHLQQYNERWSIDGGNISDSSLEEVGRLLRRSVAKAEAILGPRHLTQFEVLTGFAILYFHLEKVDVAIFEVGMGGKWDATSVVKPVVSILTSISMDHSDYLGDTIEEIAKEKSFVIKVETKAVCGMVDDSIKKILIDRAKSQNGEIFFLGDSYSFRDDTNAKSISIDGLFTTYNGLDLGRFSKFQIGNLVMAVAAAELYLGDALLEEGISKALDEVELIGRAELISSRPRILLDGAHNEAGSQVLSQVLNEEYQFDKLILILSVLRDKDVLKVLSNLLPIANSVIVTGNRNPRSLSVEELGDLINSAGYMAVLRTDMVSALQYAKELASVGDLICVTGSLYGVGEARDALQ